MAVTNVTLQDSFDDWRQKTNTIASDVGDLSALTGYTSTNIVAALNEAKSVASFNDNLILNDTSGDGTTVFNTTAANLNINIDGTTTLALDENGNVAVTANLTVGGTAEITGNTEIDGTLSVSSGATITGNVTARSDLYLGSNNAGSTYTYYYDDTANTFRYIVWDDTAREFQLQDSDGVDRVIIHSNSPLAGGLLNENTVDHTKFYNDVNFKILDSSGGVLKSLWGAGDNPGD